MAQTATVTQQQKKVDLEAAKQIIMTISKTFFSGCLILLLSCSNNKQIFNSKNGSYKYHIVKGNTLNMPVIKGQLFDTDDKAPLGANGAIKIDNKILAHTNSSGKYLFSIQPGNYRITGTGFPYKFVETKNISISVGDTLKLDMYLKSDTKTIN